MYHVLWLQQPALSSHLLSTYYVFICVTHQCIAFFNKRQHRPSKRESRNSNRLRSPGSWGNPPHTPRSFKGFDDGSFRTSGLEK